MNLDYNKIINDINSTPEQLKEVATNTHNVSDLITIIKHPNVTPEILEYITTISGDVSVIIELLASPVLPLITFVNYFNLAINVNPATDRSLRILKGISKSSQVTSDQLERIVNSISTDDINANNNNTIFELFEIILDNPNINKETYNIIIKKLSNENIVNLVTPSIIEKMMDTNLIIENFTTIFLLIGECNLSDEERDTLYEKLLNNENITDQDLTNIVSNELTIKHRKIIERYK